MASINSKIRTKADNIIGPIIVGPGIFSLRAKNQPVNETKNNQRKVVKRNDRNDRAY